MFARRLLFVALGALVPVAACSKSETNGGGGGAQPTTTTTTHSTTTSSTTSSSTTSSTTSSHGGGGTGGSGGTAGTGGIAGMGGIGGIGGTGGTGGAGGTITCDPTALGIWNGTALHETGDSCQGTSVYSDVVSCIGWEAFGNEVVYSLTIPANDAVQLDYANQNAGGSSGGDEVLYVLSDCQDLSSCIAGADSTISAGESVVIPPDASQRTVYIVADNYDSGECDNFTLDLSAFACSATDLGPWVGTAMVENGDTCTGTTMYNPDVSGCTGHTARGNELLYQLTLPANASVDITMTDTTEDASLYVITDCFDFAAANCVVGADQGGLGELETVTLTNSGIAAQTYFIVADTYGSGNCDTFTLNIDPHP